jgi:hypothetical protein
VIDLIRLDSLFAIGKGHALALEHLKLSTPADGVAYVARSHRNNGVTAWVQHVTGVEPAPPGAITVALRSRNHALAAHVQPRPFYTSYHVAILDPLKPMPLTTKLWYCRCIEANRFRYHFGRQANRTIGAIMVPASPPAWLNDIELPEATKPATLTGPPLLETDNWQPHRLADLFDLTLGRLVIRRDLPVGATPLVTASDTDNGVTAWVDSPPDWPGGQITVANNGSVGSAFYQAHPFIASRDVTVLNPKITLTPAAALFVCTLIRWESFRFNYARKWNPTRMKNSTIRLPVRDGEIDVDFMDGYVRSLPQGHSLRLPTVATPDRDARMKIHAEPDEALRALLKTPKRRERRSE